MKVFPARLADHARIAPIPPLSDAVANALPQMPKHRRRPCEMQASKLPALQRFLYNNLWVTGDELDDRWRETSFEEGAVDKVIRIRRSRRWFPNAHVAEHGRCTDEIGTNGREIERRDGEHESFEGSILDSVPRSSRVFGWLLRVNLFNVLDAESQKVAQLQQDQG